MKKLVTSSEMVEIIRSSVNGTSIVSVDLDSPMDGKMNKTGNPFVDMGIVKRETLTGVIGYDYGKAVNRLATKEGAEERQAKRHPWGDMDDNSLFRIHRTNGNLYLSMKVKGVNVFGYLMPDGKNLDEETTALLKSFVPVKKKSSTQSDLDGEVIARDYSMENIRAIRMKGDEYIILSENEIKGIKTTVREKEKVVA
jgi:hypothetical protein